jgi:hypothetical protein
MNDYELGKPPDHVVSNQLDDGDGVLVDLNTKQYFQLNETAMLVWRGLESGHSFAQIVTEMTSQYDVSAEHAAPRVQRVIDDLKARRLIVEPT